MEAPKEIYITTDKIWGSMEVDYGKNMPESVKYIRADLAELTWEDIKRINELMVETANKFNHLEVFTEKFFVEVLRRFNETRK